MLAELYVENFALIEKLQVSFHEGLNIISGETGAGKSLLTDAVGLLLGGRGDKGFIAAGTDKALVEGTFLPPFSGAVLKTFSEQGFSIEDEVTVSRELYESGTGLCRINGRRVSLGVLKELVTAMVNLHSQTEHFSFFKENRQLGIVDSFDEEALRPLKAEMRNAYEVYQGLHHQCKVLRQHHEESTEKRDFLDYRIKELSGASRVEGEDEALAEKIALLRTSARRLEDSDALYRHLDSGVESLYEAMTIGQQLSAMDDSVAKNDEILTTAYYDLEDLRNTIAQYRDTIEAEPAALEKAEERLSFLSRLKKKYHKDIVGLLTLLAESRQGE